MHEAERLGVNVNSYTLNVVLKVGVLVSGIYGAMLSSSYIYTWLSGTL